MRILKTLAASAAVASVAVAAQAETIKIGVTPGTHEEVMEVVAEKLQDKGIDLDIVTFNDYVLPNQALDDGDLDANSFQHKPYLDQQIADRGYELVIAGTNFVEPMGVYSDKVDSLDAIEEGAEIAIPNDPSNGGRALLLLEKHGLIEVDDAAGLTAGVIDITANPKDLKFVELDAAQLPRSLPDVAAAAINTNYALEAGLNPLKDAVVIEDADSPYANIIVVRAEDKDAEWVKTLVETYQTDAVRQFILDRFEGAVVPAF